MYGDIGKILEDARWRLNGYLREVVDVVVASPCESNSKAEGGVRLASLAMGNRLEEAYAVVFGLYGCLVASGHGDCPLFVKDFVDYDGVKVYKDYSLWEMVAIFRNFLKGRSPLYRYKEEGLISESEFDLYMLFTDEWEVLPPMEVLHNRKYDKFREVYDRLVVYL